MREIKFRIWNELMEKMCYPTEYIKFNFYSDSIGVEIEYGEPEYPKNYAIRGNDVKLMQFTGLHDKNGKEIYEGDIVDNEVFRATVEYLPNLSGYYPFSCEIKSIHSDDCEVIGNIYETKNC